MTALHAGERTHSGMLPQSRTLELAPADTPRGGHETGREHRHRPAPGVQHGREETLRGTSLPERVPPQPGFAPGKEVGRGNPSRGGSAPNRVFVLDRHGRPLMPCHPARARQLLRRHRARVHRLVPFVIRLVDRDGTATPCVGLGIDPGSTASGLALHRVESTSSGDIRQVLFGLELHHRSALIHKRMGQRADFRRRRRSANLRHRAPRFANRTRTPGWLAPSLWSRVQHLESWTRRLARWAPITGVDLELVRFDLQQMENPEIHGVEYQQGTLLGCEVREYLLEKWGRQCAYCDAENVPLNLDHVVSRSRGGSNRVSNLTLACVPCNERKGSRPVETFLAHDPKRLARVQARLRTPLRDAAAVNSTRWAVKSRLARLGLSVACWSGGRTKWNRHRFVVAKSHVADAAVCGDLAGVRGWDRLPVVVHASSRGTHQRTRTDAFGFPRLALPRSKTVHGFATGDLVVAMVPLGRKAAGYHTGRVAVRTSGSFRVGSTDGISWKTCRLLQRADGYSYSEGAAAPPRPDGRGFRGART